MRTYSKDRPSAFRRVVACTFIAVLTACGGSKDNSPSSINTPASAAALAATTTAVAMVTPASYTVANLGADFRIEKEDGGLLNDLGQVAGSIAQNENRTMARAYRYENGTLKNMDTLKIANSSSQGWGINANGTMAVDLRIVDIFQNVTHAFRSDGTTMTDLGALGSVNNNSYTIAINDSGMVIGNSQYGNGSTLHAFRSNGTTMTDLGALASSNNQSRAVAINASGLVIGNSQYGNGNTVHAFRSDGTTMTDLGALGNANNKSNATAINASGLVVGSSNIGIGYHAFLSDGTTMTDLGALGNADNVSSAVAINASGLIVGGSYNGTSYHAFLSDGKTMTDLGALENANNSSSAVAINASGQLVGKSQVSPTVEHAFIKSPGDSQLIDLNTRLGIAPELVLLKAIAISDSGYILARADTGWVLLKPAVAVPEPAAATLGAITANDVIAVGVPVNVSVKFSDVNTADAHTALWTWEGNGTSAGVVTEPNGTALGTVTGSATFLVAGLYNVTVTVTDSGGLSSSVGRQIVVYDPAAGFVTGGGWIMSPAGAYKADGQMTGRATFGFVSKYLKGANKPTGETAFSFEASGLNFYSNNYDWLVVGGARAQYKGSGTINGTGSYQFMLTAVDGDLIAKGTPDRFRIKIWHHDDIANTDVTDYDNQIDSSAAGSNLEGTVLGGGSINVKIR